MSKRYNKQGVEILDAVGHNGNRTKTERKRCFHFYGPLEVVGERYTLDGYENVYGRKCLNCGDLNEQ